MVDPNKLDAADARHQPQDRRVSGLRRARDRGRQLSARAARRPGEVRPQQHPVPDDAGGGREQAQHADREAGQVQEPVGSRCAARPRCCRHSMRAHSERYAGYTMRQICNEMHDFYREANIKELQRRCFRASSFPELAMSPQDAYEALVANDVDYVPLDEIKGRISATLALIYPPGHRRRGARRALGREGPADARLFPCLSGVVQPLPGLQLRGAGRVPGEGRRPHQVPHLRRSRVSVCDRVNQGGQRYGRHNRRR